jgi:hypothetical protein
MDHFSDEEIGKLLRIKRHEQPPPGYYESFLHEFHRRQRAELLKQPLWRIALQRVHDFMFQVNMGSLTSYPVGAAAVLVCAAVLTLNVYRAPDANSGATIAAVQEQMTPVAAVEDDGPALSLAPSARPTRAIASQTFRMPDRNPQTHSRAATPRYVLDSTPVSYEASLRF